MFFTIHLIIFLLSLSHVILVNDHGSFNILNQVNTSVLTRFVDAFSFFGNIEVIFILTVITIVFLLYRRLNAIACFFAVTSVGGLIVNFLLKVIIQRGRPSKPRLLSFFGFDIQIESFSFPSGHTMRITIFLFLIYLLLTWTNYSIKRSSLILGSLLIVLVGLSRLTTGAHFLTDVTAAISGSFIYVTIMAHAFNRLHHTNIKSE